MWDMTHSYVRHDSFVCETRPVHIFYKPHSYAQHDDAFICETCPIHMRGKPHSFICETRLIHICDMSHSFVRHDSSICVAWTIQIWSGFFSPLLLGRRQQCVAVFWARCSVLIALQWLWGGNEMSRLPRSLRLFLKKSPIFACPFCKRDVAIHRAYQSLPPHMAVVTQHGRLGHPVE